MLKETVYLDKPGTPPMLEIYAEPSEKPRTAMLVVPGGGYTMCCSDREGGPIAEAFLARGINAFVITYRVGEGHTYPEQLVDVARAIAYIRENAEKYSVDKNRVFTVGFSAGGHLVGTLATKYKYAERLLSLPENFTRPTGSIYAYPVVSVNCKTHNPSFEALSGKSTAAFTDEDAALYSIECGVTKNTPPAFIWHTVEDDAVPVDGSLLLINAYIAAGVSVTAHLYPYGPHGVALANEITECENPLWNQPLAAGWVDYAAEWMKTVK